MVEVLLAANRASGPIEREPLTLDLIQGASRFTLQRFMDGCARLFRQYLALGLLLILIYALSTGAYLAFVVYGYRAAGDRVLLIGWTFVAAIAAIALVAWITLVNFVYLLLQIAMAHDGIGLADACRAVAGFVRAEFRQVVLVFLVTVVTMIAGTIALKAGGHPTLGAGGLADVLWRNLAVAAVLGPFGVAIGALGRNQIVTVVVLIAVAAVLEPQLFAASRSSISVSPPLARI